MFFEFSEFSVWVGTAVWFKPMGRFGPCSPGKWRRYAEKDTSTNRLLVASLLLVVRPGAPSSVLAPRNGLEKA